MTDLTEKVSPTKKEKHKISAVEEMVGEGADLPEMQENVRFSFRYLLAFLGPGFLISIAYLDPGNINADLDSGALAGFSLLWVLLVAHILGLLLQRLSARLGVVTGKHMAEVASEYYAKAPRLILWIMIEIAIIGADIQEVIGTAIAFTIISHGLIPLWAGVLITVLDTLSFLFLDRFGFRKLEFIFCFLIAVMAITFGTEYIILAPDQGEVLKGVFVPECKNCTIDVLLQAVGLIGAVIMPHNLYLHSALVKTRKVNRNDTSSISKANMYFFIESGMALLCSFIINLFVVSVFGQGLAGKSNADVRQMCMEKDEPLFYVFDNNTDLVDVDIYKGGVYLGCAFGAAAMYIWAIGILASGQSSTMTCCYTGQFVMEGFLNLTWTRWKRVLFTRSIAILPALFVSIFQDLQGLGTMNDLLNALQMMQIPFALIPILTFTSSKDIMQNFRNGKGYRIFLSIICFFTICINMFFMFDYVTNNAPNTWPVFLALVVFTVLYLTYVFYLSFYCMVSMVGEENLLEAAKIIFPMKRSFQITFPWITIDSSSCSETLSDITGKTVARNSDMMKLPMSRSPQCDTGPRNNENGTSGYLSELGIHIECEERDFTKF